MAILDNILNIRKRILSACSKVSRNPDSITIIAVTKGRAIDQIKEAVAAGITEIGENRVQEAIVKYNSIVGATRNAYLKWHMVGHLQSNKTKEAVKLFDLIQSVDSLRLAERIDKEAASLNKIQDILIEVKTSPEAGKSGFNPDEVTAIIGQIVRLKNLNIKGLMTIAPIVDNPEEARPYFRQLRELRDQINKLSVLSYQLSALSMGMTNDYEIAIEEGSTMVRLGRAIFEY